MANVPLNEFDSDMCARAVRSPAYCGQLAEGLKSLDLFGSRTNCGGFTVSVRESGTQCGRGFSKKAKWEANGFIHDFDFAGAGLGAPNYVGRCLCLCHRLASSSRRNDDQDCRVDADESCCFLPRDWLSSTSGGTSGKTEVPTVRHNLIADIKAARGQFSV